MQVRVAIDFLAEWRRSISSDPNFTASWSEADHDPAMVGRVINRGHKQRRDAFRKLLGRPNRKEELELAKKRLRREKSAN